MPKSAICSSEAYQEFRSSVALKRIPVMESASRGKFKYWKIYDGGPRDKTVPLVCIAPASGTGDVFYLQILGLTKKGHRVISVEYPPYWSIEEWCRGFKGLLTCLHIEKVHLFGTGLGGFLAQKFAEHTQPCPRVASLVLCNSFNSTSIFKYSEQSPVWWMMPSQMLRSILLEGMKTTNSEDRSAVLATEFMADNVKSLSHSDLASRLTLNCIPSQVKSEALNDIPVTILEVWDDCALSRQVKEDLQRCYPHAKMGHMKTGGNFPFLTRSGEVNMHLEVHLRNFSSGHEWSEKSSSSTTTNSSNNNAVGIP